MPTKHLIFVILIIYLLAFHFVVIIANTLRKQEVSHQLLIGSLGLKFRSGIMSPYHMYLLFFLLTWPNTEQEAHKRGRMYFGSKFESEIYPGNNGIAAQEWGSWSTATDRKHRATDVGLNSLFPGTPAYAIVPAMFNMGLPQSGISGNILLDIPIGVFPWWF